MIAWFVVGYLILALVGIFVIWSGDSYDHDEPL